MQGDVAVVHNLQNAYFKIIDEHLSTDLKTLWDSFSKTIPQKRDDPAIGPLLHLLAGTSGMLVPDPQRQLGWTSPTRRHLYEIACEVKTFWDESLAQLRSALRRDDLFSYYLPAEHLGESERIRSVLAYFDVVVLPDPISKLKNLFEQRQQVLDSDDAKLLFDHDRGMDGQILAILAMLWWILSYRDLWASAPDGIRLVVVPEQEGLEWMKKTYEVSEKLSLNLFSEVAGVEFSEQLDLLRNFDLRKPIPWLDIARTNGLFRSSLSSIAWPGVDLSPEFVLEQLNREMLAYGHGNPAHYYNDIPTLHRYIGSALFSHFKRLCAYLLINMWQASNSCADSGVYDGFWPVNVWLTERLSGGRLPSYPVSEGELGALTLQSNDLMFMRQLTDKELSIIRTDNRLSQMRAIVRQSHHGIVREIAQAPMVAQQAASNFIERLDEYERQLREITENKSSLASLVWEKTREQAGELGLTGIMGVLGLVAAPPWSYALSAIGAVVGGQSARGIVRSALKEREKQENEKDDLQFTPLAVCLQARNRARRTPR